MALQFDPKKIIDRASRIGAIARLRVVGPKPTNLVTEPAKIRDHARRVRALARLFAASCEYSLAADSFNAAALLYRAVDLKVEAEDCTRESDENAFEAMDRMMRIVADGEPAPADDTVELVIEVTS